MTAQKVKLSEVKVNPNNPRLIKDDKFHKLVKSIKEFPEMLDIRPIVVNSDMIILGGNMRYKACKEAGLKEIPIIVADSLTEEQQREFLIKDNVSGGEWDWDILANEWDSELLEEWGLDTVKHNWEELDYIDENIETPNPVGNNVIQIIIPEILKEEKDSIFDAVNDFIKQNYEGCEVK